VFRPDFDAWIIKRSDLTREGIDRCDIRTLGTITMKTGQGKVVRDGLAAVLFGDNMVRFVGPKDNRV
jgi:hypothetical protein